MLSLRNYQKAAKDKIYEYYNAGIKKVLMQMPTGAGKTRVFCSIIHDELNVNSKFKCIVVAHTEELINQIREELDKYAVETGIIKAGYPRDYFQAVQVASIGTLAGDFELDGEVDMIVIDEAHRTGAPQYKKLFERFEKAKFLGATATPCRMDGTPLSNFYEKIVLGLSIQEMIKIGHLSAVKLYHPNKTIEGIDQINKGADGDYENTELAGLLNNEKIRARLVNSYIKHCYGKKGIVYAINREHARAICEDYNRQNITSEYIISGDDMTHNERKDKVKRFIKGEFNVLVNVNIFTEGFDCPDADFVQLARPTKSLILFFQQIGRALRTSPKKKSAIILDNAGLTLEHGSFISNEWDWQEIFEKGLEVIGHFSGKNGEESEYPIDTDQKYIEGDEGLVLEEFGDILMDEDPLIEFFSNHLNTLYETIKTLRITRSEDYESMSVIDTLLLLEPYLFDMAVQNKQYYEETELLLDKLIIEKSARETEHRKLSSIINSYNSNKNEIEEISTLLKRNKEYGVILTAEQKENIRKTLQEKYSLPIEIIDDLTAENFDVENIQSEQEGLVAEIKDFEKSIEELNNRLIAIKELAKEGKFAKEELYNAPKEKEDIKSLISREQENVSNDDILPFDTANKLMFANVADNSLVKNSKVLLDVFDKLLESSDDEFAKNLKTLYDTPSDFYKKTGFGHLKIKDCRRIIRLYLLDKGNEYTLVAKYFKDEAKNYTFENELKFLQDVLLNSDHTSPIVKHIIKYYRNSKIFICDNIFKTQVEIANELDVQEGNVRVTANRIDFEKLLQDVFKILSIETEQILTQSLYLPIDKTVMALRIGFLNYKFNVDFNGRGYAQIAREFFNLPEVKYIYHQSFVNLYIYNFSSNEKTIEQIKEFAIELISNKGDIDVSSFNKDEKFLLITIIKGENLFDKFFIDDNIYLSKEKITSKYIVEQALLSFKYSGKTPNSFEIYDWCNKHYPGMITSERQRFGSDVLNKLDTIKKVGNDGRMSLWGLSED